MDIDKRRTVAGILRTHAEERPDQPMLVDRDRRWTWGEHYARACRVGHALQAEEIGPGSRVAFLDRNGAEYFETLFGGALSGVVNVAVNWRLAPAEMAAVIDDSRAELLVIHPDYMRCLAGMPSGLPTVRRIVVIDGPDSASGVETLPDGDGAPSAEFRKRFVSYGDWASDRSETDPGHMPEASEASLQLYTSGTTGLPKGVMLSNANLATAFDGADDSFLIDDQVVSLVAMPLFHIGGSGWALAAMSRGGRSVVLRDVDPGQLLTLVETEKISHMFVVPALLMFLLATPAIKDADTSSLREVFYGASPISEDVLVNCLKTFKCNFTQVYGMTETTGAICALAAGDHDPDGPRRHLLRSAGKPFAGVELRAVDPESGNDVPLGNVGELWTRSAYTMLGYWGKADETSSAIDSDGWLRTGDAGFLDDEGYVYLHDRIKDMIVSGGENVYPAEVENILLGHGEVADAAAIGVPDDRWGETVKAIVVRTAGDSDRAPNSQDDDQLKAELIEHCRAHLAHYKCPTSVDFATSLPRNPSGKILKRELREPYWQGRDRKVQ
jgi:long-chain acyl-CoA synthetase